MLAGPHPRSLALRRSKTRCPRAGRRRSRLSDLSWLAALLLRVHLHLIAVLQSAHRIVRTRNNEVAALQPRQDLEILVAGDPHLDRHEFGAPIPDDEDAVGFFPRLPRVELRGGGDRFGGSAPAVVAG